MQGAALGDSAGRPLGSPHARSPVPAHRAGAAGTSQSRAAPACPCHWLPAARVWSSAASALGARNRPPARKGRRRPRCPHPQAAAAAPTSQSQLCFPDLLAATGPDAWEGSVCGCPCACAGAVRVRGGRGRARRAGTLPPRTGLAGCPPAALGGKAGARRRGRAPAALRTASLLLPGPHLHTGGRRIFTERHPLLGLGSHARPDYNYSPRLLQLWARKQA